MKVVCDNCDAVYKIPDDKLTKPVNKATCRSCGNRMLIPRPGGADPDERTLVTPRDEAEATLPAGKPPQTRKEAGLRSPGRAPTPRPSPPRPSSKPAGGGGNEHTTWEKQEPNYGTPAPVNRGSQAPAPPRDVEPGHDPAGDMTWALLGAFGALIGSIMLIIDPHFSHIPTEAGYRFAAAAITLGGVFTSLLVLMMSGRGRRKASLPIALLMGGILGLGAAFIGASTRVGVEQYQAGNISFGTSPEASSGLTPVVMEPVAPEDGEGEGTEGE
ncbi:MAG: zinc-ribbon domain-containing protein, partial [Proteobacteria bacterium]|nr:zinc-ribbon domain-containing protein [Pseudomonadota bacterium]